MSENIPTPPIDLCADHIALLCRSHLQLTGNPLIEPGPSDQDTARRIWEAPFVVLSHNTTDDPILTYGNQAALRLFEMTWDELITTPSRFTAEAPERDERARLLQRVHDHGFIDDYTGIRISKSGHRFRIHRATVWNLIDTDGQKQGQAATFREWTPL